MNRRLSRGSARLHVIAMTVLLAIGVQLSPAPTVNVGFSGSTAYVIGGTNNPTLTLERGGTYVFQVNATGHPFYLKTISGSTGTGNLYTNGVTGNGVQIGSLTFAVPTNAPASLYYHCSLHTGMGGALRITNAIAPPTVKVVYLNVGAFITVGSTGTNGWNAVPEFKCSFSAANWAVVPSYTNFFSGGTNLTTFGLLDPICGSTNVLLRIRNERQ